MSIRGNLMKILFLNYEYPPLGGGAANATHYILREFSRMEGVEVHLVTSGMGRRYEEEHIGGSVFVHRLPIGKAKEDIHSQSLRDIAVYSFRAFFFSWQLLAKAKKTGQPFEKTIAFFGVPCGALALFFRSYFNLPYVVSLRGSDVPGYSEKYATLYIFFAPLIRLIWKKAAAVVPNSKGLALLAAQTSPRQAFTIIPNGVDTESFAPDANREHDGYFRILVVSRLTPRKGIRYLIAALAELRPTNEKIELWIVGDGEERAFLEQTARECGVTDVVKFFGAVPHEHLSRYYGLGDVFCLPSLNEGMSNTVLEALSAGLPIVATVTGGTEELVTEGENGFFVRHKSPGDIAAKLSLLLCDENLRAQMGEASRKRALAMSWKAVAEKFLAELQGVEKK